MVSTVKQVARHDPGGLLAQERLPGGAGPPRCRVEVVAAEGGADCGCRDLGAEPSQLALDALVAPPRVLPGEADNQLLHLLIQWWSAYPVWIGPHAGDQPPMPAQQGLGLDEEARPVSPGQDAADRSEQCPVGRFEPGACDLAAEHGELVTQHQNLQVLGVIASG